VHFKVILLIIKSVINEGAASRISPAWDFALKKFSNRFYIHLYIFSFIYFLLINTLTVGIASQKNIEFHFAGQQFLMLNFILYPAVFTLSYLFCKFILPASSNSYNSMVTTARLYFPSSNSRILFLQKMLFFKGYGFRALLCSLFPMIVVLPYYFSEHLFLQLFITLILTACSVFLLNSVEILLLLIQSSFKTNSSLVAIIIWLFGFLLITSTENIKFVSLYTFFGVLAGIITSSLVMLLYCKKLL